MVFVFWWGWFFSAGFCFGGECFGFPFVTIPVWCYFISKECVARMEFLKGTEYWPSSAFISLKEVGSCLS